MPPPVPMTAKQAQGARSREEILDAAERLMGSRGYVATSVSALAKESGLPGSSIYWHFGSKSGVLGALMERGSARFFAAAAPGKLDDLPDPRQRLRRLFEQVAASLHTHQLFVRLFFVLLLDAGGEPDQHDVVARVRAQSLRLLRSGLTAAYRPWGEEVAYRVGGQLTDVTQALFDGLFLATENGIDTTDALVDQAVIALHALAEQIRAGT